MVEIIAHAGGTWTEAESSEGFRIENLNRARITGGGWCWQVRWDDSFAVDRYQWRATGPDPETRLYRTDRNLQGLWIHGSDDEWHQVQGTAQFELSADPDEAMAAIRAYIKD